MKIDEENQLKGLKNSLSQLFALAIRCGDVDFCNWRSIWAKQCESMIWISQERKIFPKNVIFLVTWDDWFCHLILSSAVSSTVLQRKALLPSSSNRLFQKSRNVPRTRHLLQEFQKTRNYFQDSCKKLIFVYKILPFFARIMHYIARSCKNISKDLASFVWQNSQVREEISIKVFN